MRPAALTLAITTYQRPDALRAVLATVGRQHEPADELIVADDGSRDGTPDLVRQFAGTAGCPVHYVRQEHDGFRVARLRNLAIAQASGDYIVFVDGDMLLHPAFLADHRRHARAGGFTQGTRILLNGTVTRKLLAWPGTLPAITASGLGGLRRIYGWHNPLASRLVRHLANGFIAVKSCNQGFWRADLQVVNGFNEEIVGWGPEDKELCARLAHHGVRRQTLLFGGIAWHLDHPPASRERRAVNEQLLAATRARRIVRCARGLDSHQSARR